MILHYAVDYIQLSNFQLQTWRLKPNIETMNGFVRRDIAELTKKSLLLDFLTNSVLYLLFYILKTHFLVLKVIYT